MSLPWRRLTDFGKRSRWMLRAADALGRSRGRLRLFDAPLSPRRRVNLADWDRRTLSALWVGHATVLLRIGGLTVLVDPVWSARVGVGLGLATVGPQRISPPALRIGELPPIDLVLITHAHFDHLDRPTLVQLRKKTPILTAKGTADLVTDLGFRSVREVPVRHSVKFQGVQVTATPTHHWGARTFLDGHRSYNGYLLQAGPARLLFAGDTADTATFAEIGASGGCDLGIFSIGAYDPYIAAHANPEQVWRMTREAAAKWVMPVHHRSFRLSHEPDHEPLQRLLAAAGEEAWRIVARRPGDQWSRSSST